MPKAFLCHIFNVKIITKRINTSFFKALTAKTNVEYSNDKIFEISVIFQRKIHNNLTKLVK